jgi:hypothetical protein
MRGKQIRGAVLALASIGATTISAVSTVTPALAHCVGSSTVSTSSGSGTEYNLNADTCNGDTIYTGRFSDISTSVSIRMRWDADQNGTYEGISGNSSSNVSDTVSGLLWTYDDANSASWFQICHTNGSGGIIACASRGTNSGY